MEIESQSNPTEETQGTTLLRTCFNGINAMLGIGILSISYALSQGGWLSLALLVLLAILCFYTGLLLRRCMDSDMLIKTYPDIGMRAFGKKGRVFVSVFLYLELYLVAVEFLILEGDNLNKLFPHKTFKIGGLGIGGKEAFTVISALVILPTTWITNLGVFAYVSVVGVLASVVLVVCLLWIGAIDDVGFHQNGHLLNLEGLPTAISLFTFCYCGHAVFPTLYTSMKHKTKFWKVLLVCFMVSSFTYGSMGIMGYLMYGEHLMSQVTLNFPIEKISSQIAIYTTLVNPLTKYALMVGPIATAVEEKFGFQNKRPLSFLFRTAIVISTVIVALVVPFFGYVMAFIGSSLGVIMSLILPCLCYIRINKESTRKFGLEMILILGILIGGSVIGVVGTYTSVKQIVHNI
ncbi:Amino acid transporter AVT1I [Linum perenne]